ncbi:MAG: type II toxin-antitoxin system VapB family antitoxin [Nesterenkonia sp.]
MNIKNPHVHALAKEASRRTGTTQTGAMEQALEQYLRSLDDRSGQDQRLEQLIDQMHERISQSGDGLSTDDLYDEDGLPA